MSALLAGSLEYWATETPDAIALVENDQALSFQQWNAKADMLAAGLKRRGVAANDIIVVRSQIRIEWPIVWAAVSKIGGRILVANWRLTPEETKFILNNSCASAFICDDLNPALIEPAISGLPLKFAASIETESEGFVPFSELPETGAPYVTERYAPLIVYTSGTTGFPKGVETTPPLLSAPNGEKQVSLITMPFHHASGPKQLLKALNLGSKIVLLRRFDPETTLATIEAHKVTHWRSVPTMQKRLLALPEVTRKKYDLSSIKSVSIGGGPAPASLKLGAAALFGKGTIIEGYGATEVGMISHSPPDMLELKPDSCGVPDPGVSVEIRRDGKILTAGEQGEIWVKSPRVVSGYLNAPPFGPDVLDARGYYRVGDIGKLDEDGFLYITDRAVDMVVSGGVNIYPAEIEAVLLKHHAIQDAAVVGAPDEEFGEKVVAFIELKPGAGADRQEIAEYCANSLASYKRPKVVELVDELPRNSMGKVLKRDLRAPLWEGRSRNI